MVNFHMLRTLLYSRHQLKAYSPSEGEQASCKEISVSKLTLLALFCQNCI